MQCHSLRATPRDFINTASSQRPSGGRLMACGRETRWNSCCEHVWKVLQSRTVFAATQHADGVTTLRQIEEPQRKRMREVTGRKERPGQERSDALADLCAQLWAARSRRGQHCIAEDIALASAQLVGCPHLLHAGGYCCQVRPHRLHTHANL